jgi:hypothetical protein
MEWGRQGRKECLERREGSAERTRSSCLGAWAKRIHENPKKTTKSKKTIEIAWFEVT